MEAQRLQVCKNKVVKTIFKLEGEKKRQNAENYVLRIFTVCPIHLILLGQINQDEQQTWGNKEMNKKLLGKYYGKIKLK